ncbi:MAG: D-alanyl-D-alanine carboxypeptidase/D-alanyl-D-alanine endopeptidase [Chthonomonadales bacterium]
MRLILAICVMSTWAAQPTAAYVSSPPGVVAWDEASVRISKLLKDPALEGCTMGVVIQHLATGRVLYSLNPGALLMPASNQKLVTSAAALAILGPDFRFITRVVAAEAPGPDGMVRGNVYLKGGGDPLLNDQDLDDLAAAVRKAGVRCITGGVVGDASLFTDGPYGDGWAWDDFSYAYSPEVSALNLNENVVIVECRPGRRAGDPVAVRLRPDVGFVQVRNCAKTAAAGEPSSLRAWRVLGRNEIVVEGRLPLQGAADGGSVARVTVEDPAKFAAAVFARKLREAGVAVHGPSGTGAAPQTGVEIAEHGSPSLRDLLPRMNKPSDNLMAECFLRMAGAVKNGDGSAAAGARSARDWFVRQGMDCTGLVITDGSGLSRQTLLTAQSLAGVLRIAARQPWADAFRASLPIAGVDGTLRNRMKGTAAAGNCRAKTGSLSGVSSLSGYVVSADGTPLVFVILMNHYACPRRVPVQIQDEIVELLAQTRVQPPGAPDVTSLGASHH